MKIDQPYQNFAFKLTNGQTYEGTYIFANNFYFEGQCYDHLLFRLLFSELPNALTQGQKSEDPLYFKTLTIKVYVNLMGTIYN